MSGGGGLISSVESAWEGIWSHMSALGKTKGIEGVWLWAWLAIISRASSRLCVWGWVSCNHYRQCDWSYLQNLVFACLEMRRRGVTCKGVWHVPGVREIAFLRAADIPTCKLYINYYIII